MYNKLFIKTSFNKISEIIIQNLWKQDDVYLSRLISCSASYATLLSSKHRQDNETATSKTLHKQQSCALKKNWWGFIFILSVLESILTMPGSRPELLQHSDVTVTLNIWKGMGAKLCDLMCVPMKDKGSSFLVLQQLCS